MALGKQKCCSCPSRTQSEEGFLRFAPPQSRRQKRCFSVLLGYLAFATQSSLCFAYKPVLRLFPWLSVSPNLLLDGGLLDGIGLVVFDTWSGLVSLGNSFRPAPKTLLWSSQICLPQSSQMITRQKSCHLPEKNKNLPSIFQCI